MNLKEGIRKKDPNMAKVCVSNGHKKPAPLSYNSVCVRTTVIKREKNEKFNTST